MTKQRFRLVAIGGGTLTVLTYVMSFYFQGGKHAVKARSTSTRVNWPTKVRAWMFEPIALVDRGIEARRDLAPLRGSWRISGDGVEGKLNVDANFSYVFQVDCIRGELHGSGVLSDSYDRADLYCRGLPCPDVLFDIMDLPDKKKNAYRPPKDGCYYLVLYSELDAASHRYKRRTECILEPDVE